MAIYTNLFGRRIRLFGNKSIVKVYPARAPQKPISEIEKTFLFPGTQAGWEILKEARSYNRTPDQFGGVIWKLSGRKTYFKGLAYRIGRAIELAAYADRLGLKQGTIPSSKPAESSNVAYVINDGTVYDLALTGTREGEILGQNIQFIGKANHGSGPSRVHIEDMPEVVREALGITATEGEVMLVKQQIAHVIRMVPTIIFELPLFFEATDELNADGKRKFANVLYNLIKVERERERLFIEGNGDAAKGVRRVDQITVTPAKRQALNADLNR